MKQIIINNLSIELERKRIKNMYLKILPPDGRIHISAPNRMSETAIRAFVMSKLDWIEATQKRLKSRHKKPEITYSEGDEIYFFGQKFYLCVLERSEFLSKSRYEIEYPGSRPTGIEHGHQSNYSTEIGKEHSNIGMPGIEHLHRSILIEGDRLYLCTGIDSTAEQRKKAINSWYRDALIKAIPPLLHKWESVMGVKSDSFTIRDMKTRWGTCNIRSRNICLNLKLASKPLECLEYVIVHELVHLLEKSHNSVFKGYMDKFMPGWRSIKRELNGLDNA